MWKNIVEPGRPKMTIWRSLKVRCIPRATITLSEHVCFSTSITAKQTRSNVKLYVHCLNFYTVVVQKYVQWRSHDMFTSRVWRRVLFKYASPPNLNWNSSCYTHFGRGWERSAHKTLYLKYKPCSFPRSGPFSSCQVGEPHIRNNAAHVRHLVMTIINYIREG